jgi:hypothetical protein
MDLGFKELSVENYLLPDELMRAYVTLKPGGETQVVQHMEWARAMLAVKLSDRVPIEVHRLFAVARGAMIYGYLFYPLFALASEQLFRAGETSVMLKCRAMGAPMKVSTFFGQISWLCEMGIFVEEEAGVWQAARQLRNDTSHPTDQIIIAPGEALTVLARVAAVIDRLYSDGAR